MFHKVILAPERDPGQDKKKDANLETENDVRDDQKAAHGLNGFGNPAQAQRRPYSGALVGKSIDPSVEAHEPSR